MATPAELVRLDALITRLTPLSQAARGELVRADDWNTIVLAIVELARAVYAEAELVDVPPHHHFDEVSLAWLDKQLRTLVSGGALKDPVQEGKLNSVERKITQLNSNLSLREEDINQVLAELDRMTTRELARENQVQSLDRQVSGLRNASDEVGEMRLTLDGITQQIATVQTIADQLRQPNGQIIDVALLQTQVNELNTLREQLRDANGDVLTGINIDQKIAQALNTLVTEEDLTQSLDERLAGLDVQLTNNLEVQIANAVNQSISGTLDDFRNQILSDNTRLFENLDATISQTVADQIPALSQSLSTMLENQINSRFSQLQTDILAQVDERTTTIREDLLNANSRLREDINEELRTQLEDMRGRQQVVIDDSLSTLRRDLATQLQESDRQISARLTSEIALALNRRLPSNGDISPES